MLVLIDILLKLTMKFYVNFHGVCCTRSSNYEIATQPLVQTDLPLNNKASVKDIWTCLYDWKEGVAEMHCKAKGDPRV